MDKFLALKPLFILTAAENFVFIIPGATQLTVIFSVASCCAAAFVKPSKAVLLTE